MAAKTPRPLVLSGDLSLRSISELHTQLIEAVDGHEAVAIGTAGVESIDVAAIQLLVSATQTAAARGRRVSLTAPADGPVARALIAAGFFKADGTPKIPSLSSWTIVREAA
jgi:ABC-type transporter Mla MlaB component